MTSPSDVLYDVFQAWRAYDTLEAFDNHLPVEEYELRASVSKTLHLMRAWASKLQNEADRYLENPARFAAQSKQGDTSKG